MRVLEVCSLYKPHAGGVETMTSELTGLLLEAGLDPIILTKRWPPELPEYEELDGVPVFRVPTADTYDEQQVLAASIATIANELSPDVVHAIGVRKPLPLHALMLARRFQAPIIGTVVGSEVPDPHNESNNWIWESGRDYIGPALLQFDVVNAVSRSIARNTKAVLPERGVIPVLPAGIDGSAYEKIEPSNLYEPGTYIFSLRRLEYSKGIDLLVEAYSQLAAEYPKYDLVIAGDGAEKHNLEHQVSRLGIEGRVRFLGKIGLEESIGLLKSAAMTVVPSRSEGGGLINAEANSVGCPLIATNVGGITEYTSDDACFLVEPYSPHSILQAMRSVIENPELTNQKVENGKRHSKSLDWSVVCGKYIDMYTSAVKINQRRPFSPWSREISVLNSIIQGVVS